MSLLNVIMIIQLFSENFRYLRAQDETKFNKTTCKDELGCNRHQKDSGFQCSVCAEDKGGEKHCLGTFVDGRWFAEQCAIPKTCNRGCNNRGACIYDEHKYKQACLCNAGYHGERCLYTSKSPDDEYYHMVQWYRGNAFAKPGEVKRFYYRAVGDRRILEKGLNKMFLTGVGNYVNLGEEGKRGRSQPKECAFGKYKDYYCLEDFVDLQFPILRPKNYHNITVLKIKDKLKGYLTDVEFQYMYNKKFYQTDTYQVFVDYGLVKLKCLAMIRLTNCARGYEDSSKFVYHRNEQFVLGYNVKYLEDGASLHEKENRKLCTAEDTTWLWTWSKILNHNCLKMCETVEYGKSIGDLRQFKKFTLDLGTYKAQLRIKRLTRTAENQNFDECYFKVSPWPLKAVIEGGQVKKVMKGDILTLSASPSYDPNQPAYRQDSLKVLWTCECLTKQIPNCEKTCDFNRKKPLEWRNVQEPFHMYPDQLQDGAEYKFTARVDSTNSHYRDYDNIAPQYANVKVKVTNETNYYIECIQNCDREGTLSNEILFLKAKVCGRDGKSKKVKDHIVFDWSYSRGNDSAVTQVDSIKLDGPPTSMLAIQEDSFEQGASYTIILRVRGGKDPDAEYSFTTKSGNQYDGNCRVDPPTGVKGQTRFDIICDAFEESIFEFYDKSENDTAEKVVFNGRMLGTSEVLGVLYGVRITRGIIEVYIIQKDSRLHTKKVVKVELTPWDVSRETIREIMRNMVSGHGVDLTTVMNYISFIPDILPEGEDKSKKLDLLLEPISQVRLSTVEDVKLVASTMRLVLKTFNKETPLAVDMGIIWKTLNIVKRQADIIQNAVKHRETSDWLSSKEIKLVSIALLDCQNEALKSESAKSAGLTEEENMGFDSWFMLRHNAHTNGAILDKMKDMLSHVHAAGLPPATVTSSDNAFQIWTMGNDEYYSVSDMLERDRTIPFGTSQHFLKPYSVEGIDHKHLFFQAALIDRNVFSWSKSDVKSKLVSLSVAVGKNGRDFHKMKLLSSPIQVKISMEKNLTNTTVKGSATQLDPHSLDPVQLDMGITIHRIDIPPKGFVTIRFLYPPTNESLRVLVMEDFRPDYQLMTNASRLQPVIINSSAPDYPLTHHLYDLPVFLYVAILPGKNVTVNKTVDYEFDVTLKLCQLWIDGEWSSIGCEVSAMTTSEETVCECNHLSIFAAAFPIPPQSIDPIGDVGLFLTVLDNPLVVVIVVILFILYLLLVLWGRHKDRLDRYKGTVVVLDDNYPDDTYPYLVAVHTSARFNAGTTAHVGIKLVGKKGFSRAHILTSSRRKVLTKDSDDWFMLYTPRPLGDIYEVQVWHDNFGSSPEWYCDKIVVYDLKEHAEFVFIGQQWLAVREGDFPEANLVLATNTEVLNMKRMFLDNSIIGFRDSHSYVSVFVRHPRSGVTRVQRVSILMCSLMVAMLCSIMFYRPEGEGNDDNRNDDFRYNVGTREFIISIQTLIITVLLTFIVLISFRRSFKVKYDKQPTTRRTRRDEYEEELTRESTRDGPQDEKPKPTRTEPGVTNFYQNYVRYVSKYLKNHPLEPVHMWEDERRIQKRKIWYTIAWSSCVIITVFSGYMVMLYGLKLGYVKSQLWLTSLVMSMGEEVFVMGPGRIILVSLLLSMAFQESTKVDHHGISVRDALLARPQYDPYNMQILLSRRNHMMYAPISSSKRLAMLEAKDMRRKWWNLMDFLVAVCFVVVVSIVISRLWSSHFYNVNHLYKVFSIAHKKQFGSVDLKKITNLTLVENYMETTFIEVMYDLWWYNDKLVACEVGKEPEGIERYWLSDSVQKPISNPLVRQVRVVPHNCSIAYLNVTTCLLKWSLWNKDTDDYGEKWSPATYTDTIKQHFPWQFANRASVLWWINQRFYGTYGNLYDVSGYETFAGQALKEAQKTFAELRTNDWQDFNTRACFIQNTVYNVNRQTFSQITLLFEYFVDGSMSTSITVIPVSRNVLLGAWELLFVLYIIYQVSRTSYLINRMGLFDYMKSIGNITRVMNASMAIMAIVIWCVHHRTSIKYAEMYMKNDDLVFFEFDSFISLFRLLQVVLSLLLCCVIARSFMLLRGGRSYLNIYYALIISLSWILWADLIFLLLLFVCTRLQYFLDCQQYFRLKELVLTQKMTSFVRIGLFAHYNIGIFVALRVIVMYFVHAMLVVMFLYYTRVAKSYNFKESDNFNFVLFVIEWIKKCFSCKTSLK